MSIYRNQRDVYYYNAPELISFNYSSFPSINGGQMTVKGFADFRYEYTPDSVIKDKKDILPLDKEAYNRLIQPILKQEGITILRECLSVKSARRLSHLSPQRRRAGIQHYHR